MIMVIAGMQASKVDLHQFIIRLTTGIKGNDNGTFDFIDTCPGFDSVDSLYTRVFDSRHAFEQVRAFSTWDIRNFVPSG
jgi:hypothetical protein